REFTYAQINQKANSLGAYLRENYAVKANTIVPIMLDRSEWMIIAILGVLKAGGAYLPIDPHYPLERIEYILRDSETHFVLSQENTTNTINHLDIEIIHINILDYTHEIENLNIITGVKDLIYIIYTSGTTGQPKGVMIENKSIVTRSNFYHSFYDIDASFSILFYRNFCFDAAIEEYLVPLLFGGKSVIYAQNKIDVALLRNYIHKYQISKINMPPILLNEMFKASLSELSSLKTIISGGDRLILSEIEDKKTMEFMIGKLHNAYGPTEASNDTTIYPINSLEEYKNLSIGKAIANTQTYILNKEQKEQPLGSIGELYIGGDGLAKGYLNKPELTEKVFIVHEKLGRIYKTGDIARYREDGNIEYLGRVDDQVKIRGFRIELGEIESVIRNNEGVKEVVVIAKEQQLIAYIVEDKEALEENSSVIQRIKKDLKNKLPSYMLPSYFVPLASLPLNMNGKIDKKALPEPNYEESDKEYVEAKNEKEEIVIEAFLEVLSIKKISTED
ncbi:MAG TPA: amino acid adenylation domain-containing protein, partial [Campylobacterales bacterium]|nr:amino acid adenylation domain-containing protein [Campylobacterales bacterium]